MSHKTVPPEVQFEFDDGTGRIRGFKSGTAVGFSRLNESVLTGFSGFNYVSLIGQLRNRNGAVIIQVIFIRSIEDAHEVYYHTLQVIFDAVRYERGNPTRRDWELAHAQATEDSGGSVYEDAEEGEDHEEAGPSIRHNRLIDVELSSDEETHGGGDTDSSDDSFNNITVIVTGRHHIGHSRPRVSTCTRDSSRSVSPPRSILSEDDNIQQHNVDMDIYTDGNVDSDSEFSEVEPIGHQFGVPERTPGDSPGSSSRDSPTHSESSRVPPSPPGHYAYSDHERDLDAPTEDELEEAFQQHLEEEIIASIRQLRPVAEPSSFRGVQIFDIIIAVKSAFPGLPAEAYRDTIERMMDIGTLTSRTDDPYYVDVAQP
ncbi:hypothetical protein CPB83DRAFT_888011 [Crepidotus variabilis]|uniref:Uncharacterized protein n=1 Tax=Crepidotus variabilis TaxID=179855 RepID=A0A9P6JX14_9AGAR|nr:hypothetical protein CPB83DRAFT_888011 [Crepidotus variabilis]